MNRKIIFGIGLLIIIIVFGIFFIPLLIESFMPVEYYCGNQKFGGLVGASSPGTCASEYEIVLKYKPLCEKLVAGTEFEWEDACVMVLQSPGNVCTLNMQELGIALSGDETADCLKEIESIEKEEN